MSYNQIHKISDSTLEQIVIKILSQMLHRKQPNGNLSQLKTQVRTNPVLFNQKSVPRHFKGGKIITRQSTVIRRLSRPINGKKRSHRIRQVRWISNDIYNYY